MYYWILTIACLMGAGAVVLGALGAHVFRGGMSEHAFESYSTAVNYLMFHAVALVAVCGAVGKARRSRFYAMGALGLTAGTVMFAGGLIGWTIAEWNWARRCAPWGGTVLIVAWLSLAVSALRDRAGVKLNG